MAALTQLPQNPLVTIVVPSYNQGAFIEETILSVLRQVYERIELIIVDGASTDNTTKILRKYEKDPRLRRISEPDSGPNAAVNKGLKLAKGDLIGIQPSSDTYQPGAVRGAFQEFASDPLLALVGGSVQAIDVQGFTTGERWEPHRNRFDYSFADIVTFRYPPMQATFFRRDLALSIGGFDEELQTCHSIFFLHYMLEAWSMGAISRAVPNVWGTFRAHPNSRHSRSSIKDLAYCRERKFACKQNAKRYQDLLTPEQFNSLRRFGYFYELHEWLLPRRRFLRAVPSLMVYLWLGGRLSDFKVAFQGIRDRFMAGVRRRFAAGVWYGFIATALRKNKLSGNCEAAQPVRTERSEKQGIDTRWYLHPARENFDTKVDA